MCHIGSNYHISEMLEITKKSLNKFTKKKAKSNHKIAIHEKDRDFFKGVHHCT